MFIQQMDDIKRHGPPTSDDEDSFEKNHGRIRDQILIRTRKQEAETQQKDTLNIFSALILLLVDSSKTVKSGIY